MPNDTLPDWERVLAAAAHLQRILPDAVLVGGTATAVYARHRLSTDADHVVADLRTRFDEVLARLESVAGWQTARQQVGADSRQPGRHRDWRAPVNPRNAA